MSSTHFLLVEDNPMDVELALRAFGRRPGAPPVVVARDGEEALALVPQWDAGAPVPTLIVLDLKMPRVDGFEVLRQLKAHPRFRRIPVVVLTTSSESSDLRAAYDLGANSYVVKPVDFGEFVEAAGRIEGYWRGLNRSEQG